VGRPAVINISEASCLTAALRIVTISIILS
jgi:hypothetical protein